MRYLYLRFRLPEFFLIRVDKMCTIASLKVRVFLDHKIIELAMSILQHIRARNYDSKYIL